MAATTVKPKASKILAQGVSPGEIGFCESRPVSGGRKGVVTHAKDLRKRHVGALGNESPLPRAMHFLTFVQGLGLRQGVVGPVRPGLRSFFRLGKEAKIQ